MELYHSGTDDILGVCGDEETETGLAHTPRYEPSWFYQEVPSEMVDRCLRARSRGGIDEAAALWLHKHLVAFGHAANAHSCHFMAHSWFECAYGLKDGAPELISSINMRLRLGQATLAKQLYERVLQQREVPRSKWVDGAQPLHSPACSRRDPDPNQANSTLDSNPHADPKPDPDPKLGGAHLHAYGRAARGGDAQAGRGQGGDGGACSGHHDRDAGRDA